MSSDNFRKLKEQIKRSKELDKELLGKVNELSSGAAAAAAAAASVSESDSQSAGEMRRPIEGNGVIPREIQDILEKLDNEGVMLLSMSEIMRLKTHIAAQSTQNQTQANEKSQLTLEIYKLRDLLSDIKNLNQLCTSVEESDWRAGIIRAISEIFLNQKDHLLTALSSFVAANPNSQLQTKDYLAYLEAKITDLVFFAAYFFSQSSLETIYLIFLQN